MVYHQQLDVLGRNFRLLHYLRPLLVLSRRQAGRTMVFRLRFQRHCLVLYGQLEVDTHGKYHKPPWQLRLRLCRPILLSANRHWRYHRRERWLTTTR